MTNVKNIETTYHILLALSNGEKRFSELLREAKKSTVAKELNELQSLRYIERNVDINTKPPKSLYRITKTGRDFLLKQADVQIMKIQLELQLLKKLNPEMIKKLKNNL